MWHRPEVIDVQHKLKHHITRYIYNIYVYIYYININDDINI